MRLPVPWVVGGWSRLWLVVVITVSGHIGRCGWNALWLGGSVSGGEVRELLGWTCGVVVSGLSEGE